MRADETVQTSINGTNEVIKTLIAETPPEMGTDSLNLLLFSVGEVFFGIDADQVSEITAYNGDKSDDLFWFHEEMGYGDKTIRYYSPTVVTIKTEEGLPYRVIIDSLENISEFSPDDIRLFPALLEPFVLRSGIWGILSRNGNTILLLDFIRLLRQKVKN
jgi:chemotaxis signal transduction protein